MVNNNIRHGRFVSLLLIYFMLFALISGCAGPEDVPAASTGETGKEYDLWIVADRISSEGNVDSSDLYAEEVGEFLKEHQELTVKFEVIPSDPQERDVYLQQLRVEILAGAGPDVYLMYRNPWLTSGLFADVTQSMHNGLFADISEYYDADTELDKEGFVPAVMEAGTLDGARYVLPLRYNIPLLCVYEDQLKAAGLEPGSLGTEFSGLEEVAKALGSGAIGFHGFLGFYLPHFFPDAFDYDAGNVTVTEEEMAAFLQSCKNIMAIRAAPTETSPVEYGYYIVHGEYWGTPRVNFTWDGQGGYRQLWIEEGAAAYVSNLTNLTQNLRIARSRGEELTVLPLRAADGTLTAEITAYGAVGAGCDNPALAYEFLREMLLKDSQHLNGNEHTLYYLSCIGWPVLSEGAGTVIDAAIWDYAKNNFLRNEENYSDDCKERKAALDAVTLTEEDCSSLYARVDKAVFIPSSITDLADKITNRLEPALNPDAAEVDIHEFARELLQDLRWQISEG